MGSGSHRIVSSDARVESRAARRERLRREAAEFRFQVVSFYFGVIAGALVVGFGVTVGAFYFGKVC